MCNEHSNVNVTTYDGKVVKVDECIAPLVQLLNTGGYPTIASCCGHGHFPGSIVLGDYREILIMANADAAERAREPYQIWWLASRVTQLETELWQMRQDVELGEAIECEQEEIT